MTENDNLITEGGRETGGREGGQREVQREERDDKKGGGAEKKTVMERETRWTTKRSRRHAV